MQPFPVAVDGNMPDQAIASVQLSVIIPAYNEQNRIFTSLVVICAYLGHTRNSWELIVVDDGSSDKTAKIVSDFARRVPWVRLVRAKHGGKGHAVRIGVEASLGAEILITDTDLSTPITELEHLSRLRGDAVAAIGSRGLPGSAITRRQGRIREAMGKAGNFLIRRFGVRGIADTQCGFKLFDGPSCRALYSMTKLNGWAFDVEVLYLCKRFGWPVVEVPVRWAHVNGSKVRPTAYFAVLGELAYLRLAQRRATEPVVLAPIPAQRRG
ncbi:dolichyl-phosphate beta-glucosyltransferase [Catelliglobosispora koreensis]|uniref:dolichyl-phosphate beta-glucosyltransferase n=1 Tax=Catelliglobosispora koreensis TaxID=129052 RepID=UPI00035DBA8B|nr:dolichyl-phosphate beta-glucosyltransferase [Catelliglobosispora koreensis]